MQNADKKITKAARVRRYYEEGMQVHLISEATGLSPSRVEVILNRESTIGRPAGNLSLNGQIEFARRIAASAPTEHAKFIARTLLDLLTSFHRSLPKSEQAGGSKNRAGQGAP